MDQIQMNLETLGRVANGNTMAWMKDLERDADRRFEEALFDEDTCDD